MKSLVRVLVMCFFMLIAGTAAAGTTVGSDWSEFKGAMEKAASVAKTDPAGARAEIEKARSIFIGDLRPALKAAESDIQRFVRELDAAHAAAGAGDGLALQLQEEILVKSGLGLFSSSLEAELAAGRLDKSEAWFNIIAAQLKLPETHELNLLMKSILKENKLAKHQGAEIMNGITARLAAKVAEEIDEALVAADPKNPDRDIIEAKVKMAEGIGYFRAAHRQVAAKLGFEDSARIAGLMDQANDALGDGDLKSAARAGEVVEHELAELETAEKLSGSALIQEIKSIEALLAATGKEANAGKAAAAQELADDAWTAFTRVESQIRALDTAAYVKIEKIFGEIKEHPSASRTEELGRLFQHVSEVSSGEKSATRATLDDQVFTGFERLQPIIFAILALLGIYPVYLISRAFGWSHRAWRNIGIFIMLLIVPVFMEAIGRFGVEMKIPALQAFSFMVNEWAKLAWTTLVFAAFLFAISGLRQFCAQFGIKAIGVRLEEDEDPGLVRGGAEVV